eukprot:364599-Chlamydomonas_euryale.AAC.18
MELSFTRSRNEFAFPEPGRHGEQRWQETPEQHHDLCSGRHPARPWAALGASSGTQHQSPRQCGICVAHHARH